MTSYLASLQARWGDSVDADIRVCIGGFGLDPLLETMLGYQLGYVSVDGSPSPGASGKRFRPLLCLLSADAVGGNWEDALPVAAAIELLHNFSLIHDDIEDRDELRRHRPTVWKVWGEALAINAGDAMFAVANRAILDLAAPPATVVSIAQRFCETALALTDGQHRDMESESSTVISADQYMRTIELKSAALIAFSVWSGAVAGGGSGRQVHALERFGLELGRAFQIQDDILGIWAATSDTGKEEAKDLANRKKTLPILRAAEYARGDSAAALHGYLSGEPTDARDVVAALEETDARSMATRELSRHLKCARDALDAAELDVDYRERFERLARDVTRQ